MAHLIPQDERTTYETFRECLSEPVLRVLAAQEEKKTKKKRRSRRGKTDVLQDNKKGGALDQDAEGNAAEDLGDFTEYLSSVMFPFLPKELRNITYAKFKDCASLQERYSTPLSASTISCLINTIPPVAIDSLESYGLLPTLSDATDQYNLFTPLLSNFVEAVTAPPPIWSTTRTTECELCERFWIPLTYHHLIPKSTHERVIKRGWHTEDRLNSVAWLCRACHSFVHRMASNEELAKSYYTTELIHGGGENGEKRAEVERWIKWVGGVRWKSH